MAEFNYLAGLWSRLKGRLCALRGNGRVREADEGQRQSRFQVEPLEPRILLSGDPVASELARLVDDATHATFLDDHAAVVEQLQTDVVADAGHADHDSQSGAVSNSQVGDERGVEWPSEWTGPVTNQVANPDTNADTIIKSTATDPAHADKVDLRVAIADLVSAFAAEIRVNPAGQIHFIVVENHDPPSATGPPTATGPPGTIEIERASAPSNETGAEASSQSNSTTSTPDAGVATDASVQGDRVQTLLKSLLDEVRAAFAAGSDDAASQTSIAGLEIRTAKLAAGEVARIDGNVILVDDDADGAGWSLDGSAAPDLASLAMLVNIAGQGVDAGTSGNPVPPATDLNAGQLASAATLSNASAVAAPTASAATTSPTTVATPDPQPAPTPVAGPENVSTHHETVTAPAVNEDVTVAPVVVPDDTTPATQQVSATQQVGAAVSVTPSAEDSAVDPGLM